MKAAENGSHPLRDLGKLALALCAAAGLLALAAPVFASDEVKNSGTGKCLDVRTQDGVFANGARVQQYHCTGVDEQQWTPVYAESVNVSDESSVGIVSILDYYYLVSKLSGKCMTVGGNASNMNGTQIIQLECEMGSPQMWRSEVVDPPSKTYHLVNRFSSKCLDLNDDLPGDGEKIQIWDCNYSVPAQKWVF